MIRRPSVAVPLSFVLLVCAASLADATIYAYTDAQGRIRITDIPDKDGRDIILPPVKKPAERSAQPATTTTPTSYPAPDARGMHAYRAYVSEAARKYNLSEALVFAVIKAESNFNPYAQSHAGAQGLMQLIPSTARLVGVRNSFDPRDNIMGGSRYLRMMLDRFGRVDFAVAAYNAGPEAVEKHRGIPPYAETRAYVPRVLKYYREFGGSGELRLASSSGAKAPAVSAAKKNDASAPLFYYRGPDGQIYISNVRN